MNNRITNSIWAKTALLDEGWADDVLIEVSDDGDILSIESDSLSNADDITYGTIIPGMTNLHSHAHQRAVAGLAEKTSSSGDEKDSFWTWRNVMYHYLQRIEPDDLNGLASQLYLEMLKFGYTGVGEFQYLHHDINGNAYLDRAEMTKQCFQAAQDTGIAFTALPVLYAYGGFGGQPPLDGQKRFLNDLDGFIEIVQRLEKDIVESKNASLGIAPHSIRAIDESLLNDMLAACRQAKVIHIHVAEQLKEVNDCLAWSDQRPVEWLLNHFKVDDRWCLIHATHMTEAETLALAKSGATAGLCPTTEANLGDGFFKAEHYFSVKGKWGIGSDSHISISPTEELRWLEYGQRLQTKCRNVLTSTDQASTGTHLYLQALAGGAQSTARLSGMVKPGYRADFVVIDNDHPRLYGRQQDDLIDSYVFSGNENVVKDVYVGGKKVISNGRHENEEAIKQKFKAVINRLAG